jgi:hypothetical protein
MSLSQITPKIKNYIFSYLFLKIRVQNHLFHTIIRKSGSPLRNRCIMQIYKKIHIRRIEAQCWKLSQNTLFDGIPKKATEYFPASRIIKIILELIGSIRKQTRKIIYSNNLISFWKIFCFWSKTKYLCEH